MREHVIINATGTTSSNDFQSDLVGIAENEFNMDLDYQPCLDLADSHHEKLSMLPFKTESHSSMLPDIIVEEIFEDDEDGKCLLFLYIFFSPVCAAV